MVRPAHEFVQSGQGSDPDTRRAVAVGYLQAHDDQFAPEAGGRAGPDSASDPVPAGAAACAGAHGQQLLVRARGRKLRNRAGHRADSACMYRDVRFPHRRAHNL